MERRDFIKFMATIGLCASFSDLVNAQSLQERDDEVKVFTNATFQINPSKKARALVVKNGKVIGYNPGHYPKAQIIDLKGGFVYPGFHDSHNHLMETSLASGGIDLLGLSTAKDFAGRIKEFIEKSPSNLSPRSPILGLNFTLPDYDAWGLEDLSLIDAASGERPLFLMDNLGHNGIVNTATLKLAKITPETPVPLAGAVGIKEGRLTGMLRETAMLLAGGLIMDMVDDNTIKTGTEKLARLWASLGYTSINDMMGTPMGRLMRPHLFRELEKEGRLPVRVHYAYTLFSLDDIEGARTYIGQDTDMVRFMGCKIFVDGAFAAGQAWTSWKNLQGGNGVSYVRGDDSAGKKYNLNRIVDRIDELGMNIHYHVQGDQGVETILKALDAVLQKRGRIKSTHTLIHLAFPRKDQIERMKRYGRHLNVTMQPALYEVEADATRYYGVERMREVYPISRFFDAKIATGISTDFSVSPLELAASWMVLKMAMQSPAFPLRFDQVLWGLTLGSAATVPQKDIGSLAIGRWADMVVFNCDLSRVRPEQLTDKNVVRLLSTWVGGRQTV
ncbi:MAG: amidohydrolase family protein [Syntrophorhabdaceae bacterium]|nr:amidohydrolase family protein [Syntrophorhabdaceae bacterium]